MPERPLVDGAHVRTLLEELRHANRANRRDVAQLYPTAGVDRYCVLVGRVRGLRAKLDKLANLADLKLEPARWPALVRIVNADNGKGNVGRHRLEFAAYPDGAALDGEVVLIHLHRVETIIL